MLTMGASKRKFKGAGKWLELFLAYLAIKLVTLNSIVTISFMYEHGITGTEPVGIMILLFNLVGYAYIISKAWGLLRGKK